MENTIDLKEKNVLVTGGSQGIGAGICRAMASCGANLLINYHQHREEAGSLATELEKLYGIRAVAFGADIASQKEVIRMFEHFEKIFGSIDVLVNNAGCETVDHAVYLPLEDWDRQVRRLQYLDRAGRRDSRNRLGFSDGTPRGQAFARLHDSANDTGEVW